MVPTIVSTAAPDTPGHAPSRRSIWLISLACALLGMLYTVADIEPSPLVSMFLSVAPVAAVLWWVYRDARGRGVLGVFDWGFFFLAGWPFMLPWYLVRTRGRQGWSLLAELFGAVLMPWFAALLVSLVAPRIL